MLGEEELAVTISERIWALVESALDGSGIDLVEARVTGPARSQVVQLTVDKAGGVTVDDCATVSNIVAEVLDSEDPIAGSYRLDVSSPGAERPLRTPEDFARAVGRRAKVKARDREPVIGVVAAANPSTILIDTGEEATEIAIDDIVRARTVLDWDRSAKPGRTENRKPSTASMRGGDK